MNNTKYLEYSSFIRLNRLDQNMNVSTLAEDCGISNSQLSKIERGVESASIDVYKKIFKSLDIDYNLYIRQKDVISNNFHDLYQFIVFDGGMFEVKQKIDEFDKYFKDYKTVEYLLSHLIYYSIYDYNNNKINKIINLLKQLDNILSNGHQQLFYDYYGYYLSMIHYHDKSILYLEKALSIQYNKYTMGMINYHLGMTYFSKNEIIKSYLFLEDAKKFFIETNNFKRAIYTDMMIINAYIVNADYKDALDLSFNCLNQMERLNIVDEMKAGVYGNIVWIYILTGEFNKAESFIKTIPENLLIVLSKMKSFILNEMIIYAEKQDFKKVKQIGKPLISDIDKNEIRDCFIQYYYYYDSNKKERMKYINKAKHLILKQKEYSWFRLIFMIMKKECVTERQYQELNDLMYQYIFNHFD